MDSVQAVAPRGRNEQTSVDVSRERCLDGDEKDVDVRSFSFLFFSARPRRAGGRPPACGGWGRPALASIDGSGVLRRSCVRVVRRAL